MSERETIQGRVRELAERDVPRGHIARRLGLSLKQVDNALERIRGRMSRVESQRQEIAELERDLDRERATRRAVDQALAAAIRDREDYAMRTAPLEDARLLAEQWLRSRDETTRRLGADLKQVLSDD